MVGGVGARVCEGGGSDGTAAECLPDIEEM